MMKEMMKEMVIAEMKMLKAETDPTKVEMMKKEMMKEWHERKCLKCLTCLK